MTVVPQDTHDPHTPPTAQQTVMDRADQEERGEAGMSLEEEAALCACYEEERQQRENAETYLGGDWPEGPLTAWGCHW